MREQLNLYQEIIKKTKSVLHYGAGNIIQDILESDSQSLGRADYAREMYNQSDIKNMSEYEKIQMKACAANIANGGFCHEYAALVFVELMQSTTGLMIQLCRIKMAINIGDSHVFVKIKMEGIEDVIVDAWGANYDPIFINDWNEKEQIAQIIIIHERISDGRELNMKPIILLLKNTPTYKSTKKALNAYTKKGDSIKIDHPLKSKENLQDVKSGFVGARGKIAYPDPYL